MSTRQSSRHLKDLVKQGNVKEVEHLLETVEAWSLYGLEEALVLAARGEYLALVALLLDAGADPSGVGGGSQGFLTPLHLAARRRNRELLTLLLARGAEVNAICSKSGETPLHEVLGDGYDEDAHLPLVRMLLEAGSDPNLQVPRWWSYAQAALTPLQFALKHAAWETAQVLLDHGADVNQANDKFHTALDFATERAAVYGDLAPLSWLLAHGVGEGFNAQEHGKSLVIAARANNVTLIEYLAGLIPSQKLKNEALFAAADGGRFEAAQRLLDLGARASGRALVAAITHHDTAMAKLLIDHGAPLDRPAKTYMGQMTPLAYAREDPHYNTDIIAYMLAFIAAQDAERARREAGHYYAAGLVKVARDPRVGKPIAHWLEQGADPNSCNEYDRTALHYLAERGRPLDEVALLLEAGADPNARDQFGYTPLHDAVLGNNDAIIQALLDAGADPAARVTRGIHAGYTPLDIARIERKEEAVRLLTPCSPAPRPLTPCEPELRRDGSVKGFSHVHYEEDVAKNARGDYIYMRETGRKRRWAEKGAAERYTEPCVCTRKDDYLSEYRGTGIPRAEHPLRWRIAMEGCLHCGSGDVLVIYAGWGVQLNSGDLVWSYEVRCNQCGYYSSWGYDER
jgi:cytohesin